MNKSKLTNYIFLLSIFSLFFSHIIAIDYSNEVGITNGMYVRHTLSQYMFHAGTTGIETELTFTKTSDEIIHVEWWWGGSWQDTGSWDVTISTNIVSNMVAGSSTMGHEDGCHNAFWIYTDVSLNDQIIMYNHYKDVITGNGDTLYNITGEAVYRSMAVWELEDAFGSRVWYEKSKGFLVNGTNRYTGGYWETFEFEATNASFGAVPGYNYFFLIGLLLISAIVILKNKSLRE